LRNISKFINNLSPFNWASQTSFRLSRLGGSW